MSVHPMQRAKSLEKAAPDIGELREELDSIRAALDRLLNKADAAGIGESRRFGRYLATLDAMHGQVVRALDEAEDETREVDQIARGVREAWARLAIAKTAADARFG